MNPQEGTALPLVGVEIVPFLHGQGVGVAEVGPLQSPGHPLGQAEPALRHGRQDGDHAAELALIGGVGQAEVQVPQLNAADPLGGAVAALDGHQQQKSILPGVRQANPAGPVGAVCQPRHRLAHQPGVAGKATGVKLQVPAVVKLQLVLPGYLRHAPEIDNVLVNRTFVAQVHKPEIQPGPGGLRRGRGGVGGGVQDHKHAVAGAGLDRSIQGGKQLPLQGDQPVPLVIEGGN